MIRLRLKRILRCLKQSGPTLSVWKVCNRGLEAARCFFESLRADLGMLIPSGYPGIGRAVTWWERHRGSTPLNRGPRMAGPHYTLHARPTFCRRVAWSPQPWIAIGSVKKGTRHMKAILWCTVSTLNVYEHSK